MSQQPQADKRTASQRIDDMERGLMALYQTLDNWSRDVQTMREAIKLLGNKLDSVVKASNNGEQLSDEVIARIMVENNVQELKEKVDNLINQGILIKAEQAKQTSFIVGRELADDGKIQNPRMQFVVSALQEDVRAKFPGAKAGDIITLQEGKWKFELQEVYDIVTPQAPQAVPQETAPAAQETTPSGESTPSKA